MNLLRPLFRQEWLSLTRGGLLGWLLGLLLLAGGYALFYGKTEIQRQHATIALLHHDEQARLDTLRAHLTLDTTVAGNRLKWDMARDPYFVDVDGYRYAIEYPRPLAALSLGGRDLHPFYQPVASRSLLRQLDPTELGNPQKLLAGHFDLSFVLVYLLPLLIIALTYNVLSAEAESGTLALLRSQPVSLARVLGAKLLFRFLLVLGAVAGLTVLGGLFQAVSWTGAGVALLGWLGVATTYALFWFGAVALVVTFGQTSAFNALVLLGTWIGLVLVAPTLTQLFLDHHRPLPDRADVLQAIRQEYATQRPKAETLRLFYETRPDLKDSDTTSTAYSLMVYYARNELVDRNLSPLVEKQERRLRDREATVGALRGLLPAVNAQDLFNRLAGADEASYRTYLNQMAAFHQKLKAFFVTKKFRNQSVTETDYAQIPVWTAMPPGASPELGSGLLALLIGAGVLMGTGAWRLNRWKY
jgi:ABC-2 type transport system permease protein